MEFEAEQRQGGASGWGRGHAWLRPGLTARGGNGSAEPGAGAHQRAGPDVDLARHLDEFIALGDVLRSKGRDVKVSVSHWRKAWRP